MTQGRMFTMDLRQFMSRGIPMAEAIAEVLGTTKDKVADLVSAGKVTSDVVKHFFNECDGLVVAGAEHIGHNAPR